MKKIKTLTKNYQESLDRIEVERLKRQEELKQKIEISKKHLNELRIYVRSTLFKDRNEEILFFKHIKPNICGQLNFFKYQLAYHIEKPFVSIDKQKKHIYKQLRSLESKKKKNPLFYKYIKRNETYFDDKYFLRGVEQLDLFPRTCFVDLDPESSTSHDLLASEVITFGLMTDFFRQELHCLANLENGFYDTLNDTKIKSSLVWTANKTDLIELVYALKISGAINNGDISIKELMDTIGELLNIDLVNYYKTYSEIRNRNKNQTKFLSRLSLNLQNKLEMDEI